MSSFQTGIRLSTLDHELSRCIHSEDFIGAMIALDEMRKIIKPLLATKLLLNGELPPNHKVCTSCDVAKPHQAFRKGSKVCRACEKEN
jgi:hypothetical protein